MNKIPVFRPSLLRPAGHPILDEVLNSGWWGTGAKVVEAESSFAVYADVIPERCLMLNSCTAALHLAVKLFPDAKRFLVPSLTFVSTALAPRYENKCVEFVEVGEDLCIDQDDALRMLGSTNDVVIAVHLGGHPAKLDKLREHGCRIIEDCAHALGTFDEDIHVGTQDIGCFSFQATKSLPIGDGGMLVMASADQRPSMTALSWCGIEQTTWDRTDGSYHWEYKIDTIGYKYRANDIMAALLLDQFEGFTEADEERCKRAKIYSQEFQNLSWLDVPQTREGTCPNWQEYIVRTPFRDELAQHLADLGIATTVHYYPIHLYKPFWQVNDGLVSPQSLPRTEVLAKEILTIPCFVGMTDEEQERVIDGVRSFQS